jgi:hypothetical protein
MAQLIAGRPRVTDGRLTTTNLAREAGVGRRIPWSGRDGSRPRAPETDAAAVRSRDAAEIADLKATVNHLAQQAQRMAMHDAEQCRAIDTLRAALADTTAGKIVPFPAVVSH